MAKTIVSKKKTVVAKKPKASKKVELNPIVKIVSPIKPKEVVATSVPAPKMPAGFISDKEVVTFEGAEVMSILQENEKERLCKLSDGTTKWVPKDVFQIKEHD